MNLTCLNNQIEEGLFRVTGEGEGEPCTRIENENRRTIILSYKMNDQPKSWVHLSKSVTISKGKMSEYASPPPKLLGRQQTQIP